MPALLALFGWGRIAGQAVAGWLSRRSLAEIGCIALAVFAGLQTLRYHAEKRESAKLEVQLTHCSSARHADALAYAAAQKAAQAANHAQVQKIEQQQQRISDEADARYQADLARLRAELNQRLRSPTGTDKGSPGPTGTPALPVTPAKPDDPSRVSIPTSLYVRGAELELQLERLQDWVRQQSQMATKSANGL